MRKYTFVSVGKVLLIGQKEPNTLNQHVVFDVLSILLVLAHFVVFVGA